jgi:hypothetical protein
MGGTAEHSARRRPGAVQLAVGGASDRNDAAGGEVYTLRKAERRPAG